MPRTLLPLAALLIVLAPVAAAQDGAPPPSVRELKATPGNQRVDLTWAPEPYAGFQVHVYRDGALVQRVNTTEARYTFFGTNGVPYVFQVAVRIDEGFVGPLSDPVAATPQFTRDLQYLAAGLIVTFAGLFAYAAGLAHREQKLEKQLEQLLQNQLRGNLP